MLHELSDDLVWKGKREMNEKKKQAFNKWLNKYLLM